MHLAAKIRLLILISLCVFTGAQAEDSELSESTILLNAFSESGPDLQWFVQNDTVMGGRSEGGFRIVDDRLVFSGITNTNGGGFSSIRSRRFAKDLSAYSGIKVKVKADGRKYTWSIQTDATWRGRRVSYWADFNTTANTGEIEEITIPFTKFYPQFRGFKLDGPELNKNQITEFALYQYDKTDGPFDLELFSVEAYAE
ncbi:CIA30 family protein [Gammaproteobacteria bacterium]|nr:CIA30 family protein [Gammaproteobacteria bacterium]